MDNKRSKQKFSFEFDSNDYYREPKICFKGYSYEYSNTDENVYECTRKIVSDGKKGRIYEYKGSDDEFSRDLNNDEVKKLHDNIFSTRPGIDRLIDPRFFNNKMLIESGHNYDRNTFFNDFFEDNRKN